MYHFIIKCMLTFKVRVSEVTQVEILLQMPDDRFWPAGKSHYMIRTRISCFKGSTGIEHIPACSVHRVSQDYFLKLVSVKCVYKCTCVLGCNANWISADCEKHLSRKKENVNAARCHSFWERKEMQKRKVIEGKRKERRMTEWSHFSSEPQAIADFCDQ